MKKTLQLKTDDSPTNPQEEDGWKPYSFSSKYGVFKNPFTILPPPSRAVSTALRDVTNVAGLVAAGFEEELANKLAAGLVFILSFYGHGKVTWSLLDEGPKCEFDSAAIAGILIWEQEEEDLGPKTREDRAADARNFLKTYTKWCNGEAYGFVVLDEYGETVKASWNHFDIEGMALDVREALAGETDVTIEGDAKYLADCYDFTSPLVPAALAAETQPAEAPAAEAPAVQVPAQTPSQRFIAEFGPDIIARHEVRGLTPMTHYLDVDGDTEEVFLYARVVTPQGERKMRVDDANLVPLFNPSMDDVGALVESIMRLLSVDNVTACSRLIRAALV